MKIPASLSKLTHEKSLLGQAVVILLGTQLLFLASFTNLNLPTATGRNLSAWADNLAVLAASYVPAKYKDRVNEFFPRLSQPLAKVRYSSYIPQTPTAVLVGYMLGPFAGLCSAALFLLLGFFGPYLGLYVFASGGGTQYYYQPGMGYLLGLVAAAWCTGALTCTKGKRRIPAPASILCGVAAAHLIGMVYTLGICLAASFMWPGRIYPDWRPWVFEEIRNLTWYQLPYDLAFGLMALVVGAPFRWLADTLVAPDVVGKRALPDRLDELLDR